MPRSRLDCRACGRRLGSLNASGVLHVTDAVRFVDLDAGTVTLRCPACAHTFTVRAHRVAMTVDAT